MSSVVKLFNAYVNPRRRVDAFAWSFSSDLYIMSSLRAQFVVALIRLIPVCSLTLKTSQFSQQQIFHLFILF